MTQPNQSELKCGHTAPDWNGEGDCITCARDKVLGDTTQELDLIAEQLAFSYVHRNCDDDACPDAYDWKEAKQAALEWHTAQIKAVLDRLKTTLSKDIHSHYEQDGWDIALQRINNELERLEDK